MLTQRGIKLWQVGLFIPDPWRRQNIPEAFINWWFCKAAQRQGVGKWIGFLLFLQKQEILLLKRERGKKNHSKIQFSVLMSFSSANECWYFVFCWAWGISAESKVNLTNWVKIASLFLKNNNKKMKKKIFKLMAISNGSWGLEFWYSLQRQNFSEEIKNSNRQEFPLYRETALNQF